MRAFIIFIIYLKTFGDRYTIAKAAGDKDMMLKEQTRMTQISQKYNEFSKTAGLPTKVERLNSGISSKSLTNRTGGGIIEMYRKKGTHRKESSSGKKVVDKPTYNKIIRSITKKGADVRIATGEWLERLEEKNASAVTIGKIIFFRPDATVSDVLEEAYHFLQNLKGLNDNFPIKQCEILNEIDAKKYLLSVTEKYKIPLEETELTKRQLREYSNSMKLLKERGEWID